MNILHGKGSRAQSEVVIANAGLALFAADQNQSLESAMGKARESLESGKALEALKKFI